MRGENSKKNLKVSKPIWVRFDEEKFSEQNLRKKETLNRLDLNNMLLEEKFV